MLGTPVYLIGPNWLSPYWERFLETINEYTQFTVVQRKKIIKACQKIESDWYPERKDKSDYVTHLYETTENYIALKWITSDYEKVIACLLHDGIEDVWDTYESLKETFWENIAFDVHILSKLDIKNKKKRKDEYFSRFKSIESLKIFIKQHFKIKTWKRLKNKKAEKLARMVVEIKICDRIHNLITMPIKEFGHKKVRDKIKETKMYFIPIVLEMFWKDSMLFKELNRAIFYAETTLIRWKFYHN